MGWDDNGLPTERRVQNYYGVRCDPSLPYDPAFEPPEKPGKQAISVSRPNFIALCERLTVEDEKAFEALWRQLGLSVDWSMTYATISRASQRVSQLAFLNLLRKDRAYQLEAPTLWDVDFRTAVAQAELEDREQPGAYHKLRFVRDGGERDRDRDDAARSCCRPASRSSRIRTTSATSRCSAARCGRRSSTCPVPILRARAGQPRQGHRRRDDLHLRRSHRRHLVARAEPAGARHPADRTARCGRSRGAAPGWESRDAARGAGRLRPARLAVGRPRRARRSSSCCGRRGDLLGEPRPITHAVKFYEKGDRPLEIVTSRQWFIRTLPFREQLLERGRELQWHPPYMRARFENWVERPERRLVRQPAALLRRAVPGLVPARRRRPAGLRVAAAARRRAAADRSVDRRAGRLHRGAARPAERLHRRPRHHGHLGDVVADAADRRRAGASIRRCSRRCSRCRCGRRRTTSSAPGCSRPCCAPSSSTDRCRGRTPRSRAGCSTPIARRCRSRRATS